MFELGNLNRYENSRLKFQKNGACWFKKKAEDTSFEEDRKNGISGEEFVQRVHEQIKKWWNGNRENKKA